MQLLTLQPSARTDHITADGHELQQLPYPFFVEKDGSAHCGHQDYRVIGFQRDLARMEIDVHWPEVWADPSLADGLYLVTSNAQGRFETHICAISSATMRGVDNPVT